MRDGDLTERASPPVAHATNGTTERECNHAPDQRGSRELKGLIDPRHFENHPRHDSVFTYGSATASRSTSAAPSIMRKQVGSTRTNIGTGLGMVTEASSGDDKPISRQGLLLGDPTGDRATAPHRVGTGRGERGMKSLPQTDPGEQLTAVKRKEIGDKEMRTPAAQSSRCTRSQLERTAPPEIMDVEELCTECKIRADRKSVV